MNPYIVDLLDQPSALRDLLRLYPSDALGSIRENLNSGKFDRIIITGMGSSMNAAYPAVIRLCSQSFPVQYINAAELLHYFNGMVGSRSLLWVNSQSGRSAELVHLLDNLKTFKPAWHLSMTLIARWLTGLMFVWISMQVQKPPSAQRHISTCWPSTCWLLCN